MNILLIVTSLWLQKQQWKNKNSSKINYNVNAKWNSSKVKTIINNKKTQDHKGRVWKMTGNGREDESRRERKKGASIKNKRNVRQIWRQWKIATTMPRGKGNKKFTSFFLFLTWICQWRWYNWVIRGPKNICTSLASLVLHCGQYQKEKN